MTKDVALETPVLRVGPFEIDVTAGELRRAGRLIRLQPQPFRLLALLASRPGELVTREEIRDQLWGGETFVDFEQGENHCIRLVRLALGDDARSPRFVETVPRRGYRLIAATDVPSETPAAVSTAPAPPSRALPRRASLVSAVLLLLLGVGFVVRHATWPVRPRLAVMPFVSLSGDSREGLAAGLTYEITTELVRGGNGGVQVVSALSSTRTHASVGSMEVVPPAEADYLLEGSVQQFEDRVRVTVQITDARQRTPIWADSYEREAGDVLALRRGLAREIIAQVQAKLRPRS